MLKILADKLKKLVKKLSLSENLLRYVGGSEALPTPFTPEEEKVVLERLLKDEDGVKDQLIERNLRLVVYISKRFENTGVVSNQTATTIGLVGTAARASGIICDARWDYPLPGMSNLVPQRSEGTGNGDVMARAKIRYEEIKASHEFLFNILRNRTTNFEQSGSRVIPSLSKNSICLAAVEAWRGKLLHVAITDNDGKLAKYKIVDPSFHNWNGLAHALRGEEISNFPICNKSFNLSYCGHDL
jgi:Ni,Fe-hydrogenase III large subunit